MFLFIFDEKAMTSAARLPGSSVENNRPGDRPVRSGILPVGIDITFTATGHRCAADTS